MRKAAQFLLLSVILVTLLSSIIACKSSPAGSSTTSNTISSTVNSADSAIRAYADPETETTLQGLSENNQAKYTQYGNPAFKSALTQDTFNTMATQLKVQYGTYVSKEFLRTEQQDIYTIVHYKVKFTKNSVGIKMVFEKDHKIAGQWFE